MNSNEQGRKGEDDTLEHIQAVIQQLGFVPLLKRKQTSGSQSGKDIQMKWMDDDNEYTWHFEVKSQKSEAISRKDILEKLDDAKRSGHEIDCWCLVGLHRDTANDLDESIAYWNSRKEYPFKIVVWSPASYIKEQINSISKENFEKIYGDEEKPEPYDISVLKDQIRKDSVEGSSVRKLYPRDVEKGLIHNKDSIAGTLEVLNKTFLYGKDHSDFTFDNFEADKNGGRVNIVPREGRQASVSATFEMTPEKHKEFLEFQNFERTEFELDESQVKEIIAKVGDTSLLPNDGKTKVKMSRPRPDFPTFNIVGTGRNYIGLTNIHTEFSRFENGSLIFDNLESPAPVWVEISMNETGVSILKIHANRESPEYEIELELACMDMLEDMILRKPIRLEESLSRRRIVEGSFDVINIDAGETMDAIHDYRLLLKKIRDIRDYFKTPVKIPKQLSRKDYEDLTFVHKAITEKKNKVTFNDTEFTVDSDEITDPIPTGLVSKYFTELTPFPYEFLGKMYDLGTVQMEHHNMEFITEDKDGKTKVTMKKHSQKSYSLLKFKTL